MQMIESGCNAEGVEELCVGLRMYFDKALPHCLLYKQERGQADKVGRTGEGRSG